ncbi:MAG: divalent metal cation transporter [candidate division Zixibacteria bacterium]|nr:divalent metal cation transporter [candidate division Zixibacteria bacterium]MDH3936734.1 divalent metal cation transporter [candidate division Zixibacteria bacterium]MDH4032681.1 divalent metal cation transporter [candidate division Zixibacteria bacterium]
MADPQPNADNSQKCGASASTQLTPNEQGDSLQWRCHPVKRRLSVSFAVSLFIIIVAMAVFYSTDSRVFTVLALVVMLGSLAKFYFPTSYRLTAENVTVKTTTTTISKPWSQYRSFYPDKNGLLLSPFAEPSRLENFRGLYLMFSGNRDEVIAFVRDHIGKPPQSKTSAGEQQT